jgi:hypothetical protein
MASQAVSFFFAFLSVTPNIPIIIPNKPQAKPHHPTSGTPLPSKPNHAEQMANAALNTAYPSFFFISRLYALDIPQHVFENKIIKKLYINFTGQFFIYFPTKPLPLHLQN